MVTPSYLESQKMFPFKKLGENMQLKFPLVLLVTSLLEVTTYAT